MKEFIEKLGWKNDPRTVDLPDNWSKPQAIIPVFDVFVCESCEADPDREPDRRPFISSSEKCTRTHWYMVHWDTARRRRTQEERCGEIQEGSRTDVVPWWRRSAILVGEGEWE